MKVKKVAFRFAAIAGDPIKTSWRDIEQLRGQTLGEGDVIEYAYAAPVVTKEMIIRACDAYDASRYGEEFAEYVSMHDAITAALGPDNGG